ncbi:MAG: hypothetical protein NT030_00750 [Candidatus Saganbacteria bacterium]|nr:hypothetical protein [Candidatus Saganbacteria bacterium]
MRNTKLILVIFLLIFSAFPAYAISIRGTPYNSTFHIGLTDGPGVGINFGIDGMVNLSDLFSAGLEIEQLVTNQEFEVDINILRYGGFIKYKITDEISVGAHIGFAGFSTSRDVEYKDAFTGKYYLIEGGKGNSASYLGVSSDFDVFGFTLTPKVLINYIADGGGIYEVDLNLGKKF